MAPWVDSDMGNISYFANSWYLLSQPICRQAIYILLTWKLSSFYPYTSTNFTTSTINVKNICRSTLVDKFKFWNINVSTCPEIVVEHFKVHHNGHKLSPTLGHQWSSKLRILMLINGHTCIMLKIESRTVIIFWAWNPISFKHMSFWHLSLDLT